jgi:hypothetical protein
MGNGDTDTAASRLRLLNEHFRQHPVTGPAGHSYISSEPRATATAPGIPYNVGVDEHIRDSVQEVVDDTLAVNPDAGPLPERVQDAYRWYMANTRNASTAQQQRRDTIIYRQQLEHAIAMGDTKVIPPHRCPACRCFGLMWQAQKRRAVCTNRRCLTPEGMSNTWTLATLAYEHVAAQKSLRVSAT